MERKKPPSPSLQLRFKRAGLQLTDGKADVVLEAPRTEKLRGVLQRYGEWEYDRLRELAGNTAEDATNSSSNNNSDIGKSNIGNSNGGGAAESSRAEDSREEASRHWEGLNFMPQGKVAYVSPEHTPQKSLLKDQHLLRVTPKKGFVGTTLLAASSASTASSAATASTDPQPTTDGPARPQGTPSASESKQDTDLDAMGQLSIEDAKEPGSVQDEAEGSGEDKAQNGAQGSGEGRSSGNESDANGRGKAEKGQQEADSGAQTNKGVGTEEKGQQGKKGDGQQQQQGQGQGQQRPKEKKAKGKRAQASEPAPDPAAEEAARREKEREERAEYMKFHGLPVSLLYPDEPDGSASGAAAMAVLDIPTFSAASTNSSGNSNSSSSSRGGTPGTSHVVKHLDALHEAVQCSYRGDRLFLQNKLLDAAQELNRSLAILVRLPDQIRAGGSPPRKGKVSEEFKTLVLSALMQSLGVRARIMGCLGERCLEKGDVNVPIAKDLFHRMFRDCLVMVKADEEGSYGYTMGALALSFLGEMEACMALLRRAGEVCKDKELPKSLQKWMAQLGHSILPGRQGAAKLATFEAVKLRDWAEAARDDASLISRLQGRAEWRALFARRAREETSFTFSAQSDDDHAALYRERPYKGHLVPWDDEEVGMAVQMWPGISCVMGWSQRYLPHGAFNEYVCDKPGCKGGEGEWGQCRKRVESKAARHVVPPGNLELSQRCNEIGIREAWDGRTLQAAMWFTRGIVLLMPHGWAYGHRLPRPCLAAALALVYNRSMMYLELESLMSNQKELQMGDWHRAMADGLWVAYFSVGWDRASRSLATMLQYPLDCFSYPEGLLEATLGYTELAPCLCQEHLKRGAIPKMPWQEVLRMFWNVADETRVALDNLSWLLEHTACTVRYTKLWELGKGPRWYLKAKEDLSAHRMSVTTGADSGLTMRFSPLS